ncbi:hypothetical protein CHU98_g1417 [Xylaria longipes]|nr:hypothetical protein CHU98_g1417 [Xylaria longipes]
MQGQGLKQSRTVGCCVSTPAKPLAALPNAVPVPVPMRHAVAYRAGYRAYGAELAVVSIAATGTPSKPKHPNSNLDLQTCPPLIGGGRQVIYPFGGYGKYLDTAAVPTADLLSSQPDLAWNVDPGVCFRYLLETRCNLIKQFVQ